MSAKQGPPSASTSSPGYHLERSHRASSRLNMQHQVFARVQLYHIHPAVKLEDNAKIADVATGTAIWLIDLAERLPTSTALHGFDVQLSEAPNPQWLPENVCLHQWDVFKPVKSEFCANYDLTNTRFLIQVVRDHDPGPVLEQLKMITKPGGFVQWTENDMYSLHVEKVSPHIKSLATEELLEHLKAELIPRAGSYPGWANDLPRTFREHGLQDVQFDHWKVPKWAMSSYHDNVLLGIEEISNFLPDGDHIRQLIKKASAEIEASQRGVAIVQDFVTVVGRVTREGT